MVVSENRFPQLANVPLLEERVRRRPDLTWRRHLSGLASRSGADSPKFMAILDDLVHGQRRASHERRAHPRSVVTSRKIRCFSTDPDVEDVFYYEPTHVLIRDPELIRAISEAPSRRTERDRCHQVVGHRSRDTSRGCRYVAAVPDSVEARRLRRAANVRSSRKSNVELQFSRTFLGSCCRITIWRFGPLAIQGLWDDESTQFCRPPAANARGRKRDH